MKIFGIKIMKIALRIIYAPMKLLPTKQKITYLSRQSDQKSLDMLMLSEEIKKNIPDIKQVFRLKMFKKSPAGVISYLFSLLGDTYHIATSKLVICDTYSIPVSCLTHKKELQIVQMWHAMGAVKKFGLQSIEKKEGRSKAVSKVLQMHENYDYVLAPSAATAQFYKEAFCVKDENIVLLSLPRIDALLHTEDKTEQILRDNPHLKGKRLVLYLPTFRANEEQIVEQLKEAFDRDEQNGLIVSLHPLSRVRHKERYGVNGGYSVFELIRAADCVITDYSACAFEAAVAGKKLYFYVPDYQRYQENRGINIDLKREMSSCVFEDAKALKAAIERGEYDDAQRQSFREKYISKTERCTEAMGNFICKLIAGAGDPFEVSYHEIRTDREEIRGGSRQEEHSAEKADAVRGQHDPQDSVSDPFVSAKN